MTPLKFSSARPTTAKPENKGLSASMNGQAKGFREETRGDNGR